MTRTTRLAAAIVAGIVVVLPPVIDWGLGEARGQTWTAAAGNGDWNTFDNWDSFVVPNSSSAVANFTGNAVGNTVNVSSSVQVQSLNFSNPTGFYPITASTGVTLTVPAINVAAGVTGNEIINLGNTSSGSLLIPPGAIRVHWPSQTTAAPPAPR